MQIEHEQVWTALQLMHRESLEACREESILRVGDEDQLLLYVPRFQRNLSAALRKAVRESSAVILYTWQTEVVRQVLRDEVHVQIEPIPESLARKFGIRV